MPDSPFVAPPPAGLQVATQTLAATKTAAAASLAGGIIAASGRPHSVQEALEILQDVHHALFPAPGAGHYEQFKANPDRLARVRT